MWFGCASHNLNLAVKHGMDMRPPIPEPEVRTLAFSVAATKALVSLVRLKGIDYHLSKTRKQECDTRWNSLLAMVRSVIDSLDEMRAHPAFKAPEVVELMDSINPTGLTLLVAVLTPLEIAAEKLSGDKYAMIRLVVPTKERLK